jgi:RNA 2',3'-cyclic 3'-phosphodiesterase
VLDHVAEADKMPAMNRPSGNPSGTPSGNSAARVFFALWPTAAESGKLAAWQEPLRRLCGGRDMGKQTLHSTLVFIGNVEQARLETLELAAQEVSGKVFELCFDAARYWQHNRIVYAAPGEVPPQLVQLVVSLELSLDRHGFSFDKRAYQPHVTLLRNARQADIPLPAMQRVCWQMRDFVLAESVRQDEKAGYRVLARFPLPRYGG